MLIAGTDLGDPAQDSENTATVAISVQRNDFAPEFRDTDNYAATINENMGEGNEITRIQVVDEDNVEPFNQISFRIIGKGLH